MGNRGLQGSNVSEKTRSLLDFVTNKRVLNVLYEVMFKFQKVQDRIGLQAGINEQHNLDLEVIRDQFLNEVREEKQLISREEARKLALFKLTGANKPPLRKKKYKTQRAVKTAFQRPPRNLLAGTQNAASSSLQEIPVNLNLNQSHENISDIKRSSECYILEQEVKFP